jgi:hypothetical protein
MVTVAAWWIVVFGGVDCCVVLCGGIGGVELDVTVVVQ